MTVNGEYNLICKEKIYDGWRTHMKSVLEHSGWWKHVCSAVKKDAATDQATTYSVGGS